MTIVRAVFKTDVGKKRTLNEDRIGFYKKDNLYLVCDGMGGQAAGDLASNLAVETIINYIKLTKNDNFLSLRPKLEGSLPSKACSLVEAIRLSNRRIFSFAVKCTMLRGMGTTVASIFFEGSYVYIAHVGDSRVYRIRNGKIESLTQDHSWVNELLQDEEISEEEAKNFKQKNVITRALGTKAMVKVDLKIEKLCDNDLFVICSDGLSGVMEDEEICRTVVNAKENVNLACDNLIDLANKKGGPDNISVIVLMASQVDNHSDSNTEKILGSVIPISEEDHAILHSEDELLEKLYGFLDAKKIDLLMGKKSFWRNPVYISLVFVCSALLIMPILFRKESGKIKNNNVVLPIDVAVVQGKVTVNSIPSGMDIFVDGQKSIKTTPAELLLPVNKDKSYQIAIRGAGYKEKKVKVSVVGNDAVKVNESLDPEAQINFVLGFGKEFEENAAVFIDDKKVEFSMERLQVIQAKVLSKGKHRMDVKSNDKILWSKTFNLEIDEIKTIVIE